MRGFVAKVGCRRRVWGGGGGSPFEHVSWVIPGSYISTPRRWMLEGFDRKT